MKLIQPLRLALALVASIGAALPTQAASLVNVITTEVWNGTNNPHAANGVTLTGSGTLASPFVYTIPAGMAIAGGGSIRLSTTVDWTISSRDTNNITFTFTGGGNLQMDRGATIDVGSPGRAITSVFTLNMGGGSITGEGTIIGIDHVRTTTTGLLGVQPRCVVINGARNVSLVNFDTHVENAGSLSQNPAITATGSVIVSGTINVSDIQTNGGNRAQSLSISAGFIEVNNVDAHASRTNGGGTGSGVLTFTALNAAGGYSTSSGANAYTNQIVVKGNFTTAGFGTSGGNITLQSAVLRMDTGSSLAIQTNGVLTAVVGVTNVSVPTNLLFMNISGTTVGPAGTNLIPAFTVTWDGAYANSGPFFLASPVVKPAGMIGGNYTLGAQTLAGSALDYEWDPLTFAKLSGPAWLSVASDGGLSGTPGPGDWGTNTWSVTVSDGSLSATGTLQIIVGGYVTVSSTEVWNGSANLHVAQGVTLSGAGNAASPYVYTIPGGMRIASGASIRLSASVDTSAVPPDTNYITFKFAGSSLQMDSGAWIDVGHPNRNVTSRFLCDLGGGSITGAGKILGIDHSRPNAGAGENVRFVTITNAASVSLANIDTHVENLNATTPDLAIYASNSVSVSGTIDTRYASTNDHGHSGNCIVYAGSITVSNVDTRSMREAGFKNGNVTLVALNAAGGYSTGSAANAYTNQLVVKGAINTAGPSNILNGNLNFQAVVLRLDAGSSLAMATNGVLSVVEGTTNVSVPVSQLFMNISGTLVGPSGLVLNATNTVTWDGTLAAPYFLTAPVVKPGARVGVAYSAQTLAGSAVDPQWVGGMTYAKVSGPSWLSVASDGSLSGTPADGDTGTNTWSVSVSANSLSSTGTLLVVVGRLATISGTENWDGVNNPHAADGVTLAFGSGTEADPAIYTIPDNLVMSGSSLMVMSPTTSDDRSITLKFTGGNLQMDSGAAINVARRTRIGRQVLNVDMGGGSITGAGQVFGLFSSTDTPRVITIANATDIYLTTIDLHVENVANGGRNLNITALNHVEIGSIDNSDRDTGGSSGGMVTVSANTLTVTNIFAYARRSSVGASGGTILLKALAPPTYAVANGTGNSYANTLSVHHP